MEEATAATTAASHSARAAAGAAAAAAAAPQPKPKLLSESNPFFGKLLSGIRAGTITAENAEEVRAVFRRRSAHAPTRATPCINAFPCTLTPTVPVRLPLPLLPPPVFLSCPGVAPPRKPCLNLPLRPSLCV